MDIMAGTGTIIIAGIKDRNVICIELEEPYQKALTQILAQLEYTYPGINNKVTLLFGDCRDFLPIPVHHIVFSPPYAMILKSKTGVDEKWKSMHTSHKNQANYSGDNRNVGNLNRFIYNQAMVGIYQLCYESILPGGTLTVILKDYMNQGKRIYLSDWLIRTCVKIGFKNTDWFKREAMGSGYQDVWRGKGITTVDDEDIVIFTKEE